MGVYLDSLSDKQRANIRFMIERMAAKGITNRYMQAGILAVVSKESSFIPKSERSYANTSNDRIRKVFGSRVSDLSESQLTTLKKNPEKFFNKVYGGRYGNAPNEGYKYRGRGLNQLTFKANYKKINAYTDVDIVKYPDRLNEIEVATDAVIGFFQSEFLKPAAKLSEHSMTNINDAKSTQDAVGAAYHANTGWGKSQSAIEKDPTGGYKKAKERVGEFYDFIEQSGSTVSAHSSEVLFTGKVTASSLVVRSGAGTKFSKTGSLKKGTAVSIYAEKDGWLRIDKNKWVSARYVAKNKPELPMQTDLPIRYHKSKVVPYAKELQQFLNRFLETKLKEDGKPGKNTSDAFRKVMGYYLLGDPRKK